MGNTYENWMHTTFNSIANDDSEMRANLNYKKFSISKIGFLIKYKLLSKLLKRKKIMKLLLVKKGLTKEQAKTY